MIGRSGSLRAVAGGAFLLLVAAAFPSQEPGALEIRVGSEVVRTGRSWTWKFSGRTKSLPDGSVVTLRLRSVVTEIEGMDRKIRTPVQDPPWIRKVVVRSGRFQLEEKRPDPGPLDVEACFRPEDQVELDLSKKMGRQFRPHHEAFHFPGAPLLQRFSQAEEDTGRLKLLVEKSARQLREVAALVSEKERLLREGPKALRELEGALEEVQRLGHEARLQGSIGFLGWILTDAAQTLAAQISGALPAEKKKGSDEHQGENGTGEPVPVIGSFGLSDSPAMVESVLVVSRRERAWLVVREVRSIILELMAVVEEVSREKSDTWTRRKAGLMKEIEALRETDRLWRKDSAYEELACGGGEGDPLVVLPALVEKVSTVALPGSPPSMDSVMGSLHGWDAKLLVREEQLAAGVP